MADRQWHDATLPAGLGPWPRQTTDAEEALAQFRARWGVDPMPLLLPDLTPNDYEDAAYPEDGTDE